VIAQRMALSARTAARVTLTTEVDATALVELRAQLNRELEPAPGLAVSYNNVLVRAVALALRAFPYMNATQRGDEIHLLDTVNIGVAVDTPRGLLVPVVFGADKKGILEITRELHGLIERALAGKSSSDELSGGTFTISNLGMFGVDAFTPIINPPELAILGVGRIVRKPAEREGQIALRWRMALSLSFDHHLVDGAPAARFLQRVTELVESPFLMLM
jgi:pyruvate dehydrogenase E2 component (dihydrolipoamide acetyltransferase)